MITTKYLLNSLCLEKQLDSDRQVAAFLEISHTAVHKWRNGGTMSDDIACEVAQILGLDVDLTLLAIVAERSKNQRVIDALQRLEENQKIA